MDRTNINIARSIAPLLSEGWRFNKLETQSRKNNYTHPAVIICGKHQMIFKDSSKNLKDRIEIYCVICPRGRGEQIYNQFSVNRNISIYYANVIRASYHQSALNHYKKDQILFSV
jgi:hypothetical protein